MALPDDDRVVACINDVQAAVQSVALLKDKQVFIYDEGDFADKIKGVRSFPAVGIVYEGMRRAYEGSKEGRTHTTGGMGSSVTLVLSIMVVNTQETLINADTKVPTMLLLGQLRRAMLDRRNPSGHYWSFLVEAPATAKNNLAYWVQRWETPLQLMHNVPLS